MTNDHLEEHDADNTVRSSEIGYEDGKWMD
jgi:hypothetical protein